MRCFFVFFLHEDKIWLSICCVHNLIQSSSIIARLNMTLGTQASWTLPCLNPHNITRRKYKISNVDGMVKYVADQRHATTPYQLFFFRSYFIKHITMNRYEDDVLLEHLEHWEYDGVPHKVLERAKITYFIWVESYFRHNLLAEHLHNTNYTAITIQTWTI